MRIFTCQTCGQLLYFENIRCERCGRTLGYLPDHAVISALEPLNGGGWRPAMPRAGRYRFCANQQFGVCNWMLPERSAESLCAACRHNRTIPDCSVAGNAQRWARLEGAKHRLFYTLLKFHLPLANRIDDPERGLAFDFLDDASQPHSVRVTTGHDNGLITIALREAGDAERERIRTQMHEPYRTLLGHFRHEIGHYFWNVLVRDGNRLASFRAVFGNEEQDYAAALQSHYGAGPQPDWPAQFVSSYASSHPWEDFAETWAHYLHIVDTLETAHAFRIKVRPRAGTQIGMTAANLDPDRAGSIENLLEAWLPLTFAVNSLNRSMGHADIYPFVLSQPVIGKLGYVHSLVHGAVTPDAA